MLYRIIKDHQKLAAQRSVSYRRNRSAKIILNFMRIYWAILLLFIGFTSPTVLQKLEPDMPPYHLVNQGLPFLLFLDFLIRFIVQAPVSREIKPYLLLPVPKRKLMAAFLLQSGASSYNLFSFFAFVPFAFLTLYTDHQVIGMAGYLLGIWLLMVLNSYWYQLCKMLLSERTVYVLLPVVVYGLLFLGELFSISLQPSLFFMHLGEGFITLHPLSYILVALAIGLLFLLILRLQKKILYTEISKTDTQSFQPFSSYRLFDSWGETGSYLELELKLISRNKNTRSHLRLGALFMLGLSLLLAFTDIYNDENMIRFICIYDFAATGILTLGKTMCFEGNYLDGLLTRNGSLLPLLRAKYYLNLMVLLFPFLILMVPVCQGKLSFFMVISYLSFTGGVVFFLLLQMAVYNQHTLSLNQTVVQSNKSHSLASTLLIGAALGLPMLIDKALHSLLSADFAYAALFITGLFFIFTHLFWIKNIHQRFQKRKYENMEGFRATK